MMQNGDEETHGCRTVYIQGFVGDQVITESIVGMFFLILQQIVGYLSSFIVGTYQNGDVF